VRRDLIFNPSQKKVQRYQLSLLSFLLLCGALPIWMFLTVAVSQSHEFGWHGFVIVPLVLVGITAAIHWLLRQYRNSWATSALLAGVIVLSALYAAARLSGGDFYASPFSPDPFADMRRQDDPRWSPEERRIVSAAHAYLEKNQQKPLDARYRIDRTEDGYEVFVEFVAGYTNGHPLFYPGGHGILELRKNGEVVRYLPGE
jgi:hypothetical protein